MLQEAFDRYSKNLLPLVLVGLIAAVILAVPGWILGIMGMGAVLSLPLLATGVSVMAWVAAVLGALLLAAVLALFLAPLAQAGLVGAVRDVLAGNPVEPRAFFSQAARTYVPFLLYTLMAGLTWIGFGLINIIPILGTLAYFAAMVCMGSAFFVFAPYAMLNEGLSPGEAYRLAWQCVTKRFGDTALNGVIMSACVLVMFAVGRILAVLPIIGGLAVGAFAWPFIYLFLSMRYMANVRPYLTAPGASPSPQ